MSFVDIISKHNLIVMQGQAHSLPAWLMPDHFVQKDWDTLIEQSAWYSNRTFSSPECPTIKIYWLWAFLFKDYDERNWWLLLSISYQNSTSINIDHACFHLNQLHCWKLNLHGSKWKVKQLTALLRKGSYLKEVNYDNGIKAQWKEWIELHLNVVYLLQHWKIKYLAELLTDLRLGLSLTSHT